MGADSRYGRGMVGGVDAIVGWGRRGRRPIDADAPTPVVRVSRSMGVCYASHLLPSFASRLRWGCASTTPTRRSRFVIDEVCCASHLLLSFASRVR